MVFRPVKQSPLLDRVENAMHEIGMVGTFMGSDSRKLGEILRDDQDMVCSLGLTHDQIAAKLEVLTKAAKTELGDVVVVDNRYEVNAEEVRGTIPCPWMHPGGLFRKSHVELRDLESGQSLIWTDLSIHLIRKHGFYEGKGSPYRIEPKAIKLILFS